MIPASPITPLSFACDRVRDLASDEVHGLGLEDLYLPMKTLLGSCEDRTHVPEWLLDPATDGDAFIDAVLADNPYADPQIATVLWSGINDIANEATDGVVVKLRDVLAKFSSDERKRLEHEAREEAVRSILFHLECRF